MVERMITNADVPELVSVLQKVRLFQTLSLVDLERLALNLRRMSLPAGTVLFAEGSVGETFYVIVAGQIAVLKSLGTADERLLGLRGSGEFIGEMSLLSGDRLRTATTRAHVDSELLEVTRDDFDALLRQYPGMAYEMLRVLSERLRSSNDATIRDLQQKNAVLAQAYADLQAAQAQLLAQEALRQQLQLAREIQLSMLPPFLPRLPGIDLAASILPASMVGGDFYDLIWLAPDRLAISIGDVSGKGVPAALFMALTCSLLRAELLRGASPAEALLAVNRHVLERNAKRVFVSLICGILDQSSRSFHYVRAGHEFPELWLADGSLAVLPEQRGQPLGIFGRPLLDERTITLEPGSTLLLYTDGVCEAMNSECELFGYERIGSTIAGVKGSARQICDALLQAIQTHQGLAAQSDDITMVVLRVPEQSEVAEGANDEPASSW